MLVSWASEAAAPTTSILTTLVFDEASGHRPMRRQPGRAGKGPGNTSEEEPGQSQGIRRYARDVRRPAGRGGLDCNSESLACARGYLGDEGPGKDVYGEKPACYNIYEGMRMIQAQRETRRMMQVGSQHRSWPFKIKAIAAMQQGLIGKVYMSKALCYKLRPSIGHTPDSPTPPGLNWDLFLGPAPMRPFNQKRFAYYWHWFWDTGNGDIGNQGVHETGVARWALGDPGWPKTATAFGGKFGIDDDTETPNTLTAGFSYGNAQLVIEVRGKMTNGEGVRQARVVTAGPGAAARAGRPAEGAAPGAPAPTQVGPANNPINVGVGNLFYGSEGWAAMSDQGFQAYKGDSSELIMEERNDRGSGDSTGLHMQNFLACVKSRREQDLHDPIANAVPSANLCHLANISYRVGRVLNIEPGVTPKFTGDAEATKMVSRPVYRKPYEV